MKRFKLILLTIFLISSLYSNDVLERTFLDISTGYSNAPYTKNDKTGNISINQLDKNGYLYDLAIGYRINESVFTTLNYQYSKFKQIDYDDYYITLNYQFDYSLNPYLGILLGKSYLHWNKDPLNSSTIKDINSGSFIYGVQAGLEYKISNNISFLPKILYTRLDHGTNLISLPASSYLEHKNRYQILFGLRFWF